MDRRIELIISKIQIEISMAWNTAALAALVDLSSSRFRHLFKQETGSSPGQYIKGLRLRQAELMLRTTFLSVKEIVKQVGFSSNSHFVSDFRNAHGLTPTAYRKRFGPSARVGKQGEKR